VNRASSRARSLTDPATSPDITGGSALTTGICDTPYSRRISMASRIVSLGCVCTRRAARPTWPQDVADGALAGLAQEAVGVHPLVGEDLGQVAAPTVGQQDDDDASAGRSRAICRAATTAIPQDPPTSRPSSRASRRVIANESASVTATTSSTTAGS
jgi:hypothetical protein